MREENEYPRIGCHHFHSHFYFVVFMLRHLLLLLPLPYVCTVSTFRNSRIGQDPNMVGESSALKSLAHATIVLQGTPLPVFCLYDHGVGSGERAIWKSLYSARAQDGPQDIERK